MRIVFNVQKPSTFKRDCRVAHQGQVFVQGLGLPKEQASKVLNHWVSGGPVSIAGSKGGSGGVLA